MADGEYGHPGAEGRDEGPLSVIAHPPSIWPIIESLNGQSSSSEPNAHVINRSSPHPQVKSIGHLVGSTSPTTASGHVQQSLPKPIRPLSSRPSSPIIPPQRKQQQRAKSHTSYSSRRLNSQSSYNRSLTIYGPSKKYPIRL
jgi:hypothetical protein